MSSPILQRRFPSKTPQFHYAQSNTLTHHQTQQKYPQSHPRPIRHRLHHRPRLSHLHLLQHLRPHLHPQQHLPLPPRLHLPTSHRLRRRDPRPPHHRHPPQPNRPSRLLPHRQPGILDPSPRQRDPVCPRVQSREPQAPQPIQRHPPVRRHHHDPSLHLHRLASRLQRLYRFLRRPIQHILPRRHPPAPAKSPLGSRTGLVLDERPHWLRRQRRRLSIYNRLRRSILFSVLHARGGGDDELFQPFDRRIDDIRRGLLVLAAAGVRGTEVRSS